MQHFFPNYWLRQPAFWYFILAEFILWTLSFWLLFPDSLVNVFYEVNPPEIPLWMNALGGMAMFIGIFLSQLFVAVILPKQPAWIMIVTMLLNFVGYLGVGIAVALNVYARENPSPWKAALAGGVLAVILWFLVSSASRFIMIFVAGLVADIAGIL